MNTIEQQSIQKQRVVNESPPAVVTAVHAMPFIFGGFVLFAILIALMPVVWDHGGWVGRYVDVLFVALIFGAFLLIVVRFYTLGGMWWHTHYRVMLHRNIVQAGDVVIRVHEDGSYDHLSAEHESAKILPQPKDEPPIVIDMNYQAQIKELHDMGMGRKSIYESLKAAGSPLTEYDVRKILENMRVNPI